MATLVEIEGLAENLSKVRSVLKDRIQTLEYEIAAAKRRALPGIRKVAEEAAVKHQSLKEAISESFDLFKKPKTQIFHGIKVGFQKGKGSISWDDSEMVIRLIRKHFLEQADILIKITEEPVKSALTKLSASDLKKLGVTVEETGDEVIIKATDSEIDRIVGGILKEEKEIEEMRA